MLRRARRLLVKFGERLLDLLAPLGKDRPQLVRDTGDLGMSACHRTPCDTETTTELGPQGRLVQKACRAGLAVELA